MSYVVQSGAPPADQPSLPSNLGPPSAGGPVFRPRRKRRAGVAMAFVFTVVAFIVVACSGDNGVSEVGEQSERAICNLDECNPPPHEPCGTEGNACCRLNNSCQAGLVCAAGTCMACGGAGGPCCANNTCNSGSACQNGTCVRTCGAQGLACCSGSPGCDSGLVCSSGTCNPCGRGGQACCGGGTCNNGFNCTNGTCNACGGNGQTCCASGTTCGNGLYCATGNTCKPIPCGTAYGPCCPGFDWQQCSLAGPSYACNVTFNRCELCGSIGGPCCVSGQACNFPSSAVCDTFSHTCQQCGSANQLCCSGSTCQTGYTCGSNGRCQ